MRFQDIALVAQGFRPTPNVPVVGVFGHDTERLFLTTPTDQEFRVRLLGGFGIQRGFIELIIFTLKRGFVLRPKIEQNLTGLVQAIQPFSNRIKWNAVCLMLIALPSATEAADETPAGHDIDRGGHFGQHGRVPVCIARYQRANAHPARLQGETRERGPALQGFRHRVGHIRHKMIGDARCIPTGVFDMLPQIANLLPSDARDAGKQTEFHRVFPLCG